MKKEYIKPLMESELFIPNEYIATCRRFIVTCLGGEFTGSGGTNIIHQKHGETTVKLEKDPNCDILGDKLDQDGFVYYAIPNYGNSYMGEIGGVDGPHPIKWEEVDKSYYDKHPNAS